jgi:hypothetical protein
MSFVAKAKYLIRQFPFIYPVSIINSCQDWIIAQRAKKGVYYSQRGQWFKDIFAEDFLHHPTPQTVGQPYDKAFYPNRDYRTDKATLFYLQNTYVLGHKGLILNANHGVFQQFSHHFNISTLKKFLRQNPFYVFSAGFKKVEGVGAVLISPESHNYYHWLSDVLPRIKLYESVLDKIDYFCVASNVPQKFLEILSAFNIPTEKILLVGEKQKIHFDHFYVASLPGSEGRSPVWAVNFLREKLISDNVAPVLTKKIYLKRGDKVERRVINEAAIISKLQSIGFEIIEPDQLTIGQQVALMQQVAVIVSAHGAALSNLLFAVEGTAVIELFSTDYFRTDCYYTLASILKLNYWYITGDKPAGANWGDITVDEDILLATISEASK